MLLAKNRKALHEYSVVEKYVAGIVLKGFEVKAVRENKASFEGSYVKIIDDKPYVVNMYIGPYSKQGKSFDETSSKRSRLLLLNKHELRKIITAIEQKGVTAVPLALLKERNLIKLEFAVVRGLKEFERKEVTKDKQILRDLARESKQIRSLA